MLLAFSPRAARRQANYSGRPAASWGTLLSSNATTANAEGTITEIVDATADEADCLIVYLSERAAANTATDGLVNLYLGPSGSEVLWIPNLLAGWSGTLANGFPSRAFVFPIKVPRGVRISGTHRSPATSVTVAVRVELLQIGWWAGQKVQSVGEVTASSRGTTFTPGTTADGAWTTLGTTGFSWKMAYVASMSNADASLNAGRLSLELGVGSAPVPGCFWLQADNTTVESHAPELAQFRPVQIASGTTVQVRGRFSGTAEARSAIAYGIG